MATIRPRRGTTTPGTGTILQNELAVDTTNKRIFIGAANGSGTLIGSAPAGSDTQIQFNDGGFLGGDAGLTFNKTTDDLTIGGDLNVNGGDLFTTQTTATVFNTTATTVNIGGAATTMAIGNTATAAQTVNMFTGSTGASTYNFATGGTANATTKTLNIGTGGAAGSTTNINIGSSIGGTTTINSVTVVGSAATQNLFNTIATTLNIGGAANSIVMGSTSATINLRGGTLVGSQTTQNVFNSVATTINAFGGATTACNVGPTSGAITLRPPITYIGSGNGTISTAPLTGLSLTLSTNNGNITIAPLATEPGVGSATSLTVTNGQNGAGTVNIDGGNLYLGRKSTDFTNYSAVDIVFEGSADDANETTLTVANPTADRTITLPDATGTVALTANNLSVFAATTSAQLAGVINDETGFTTGALLVFNTSPSFTTSVVTGSASFDVFNTTATTLNVFGAATNLAIGNTATAAQTVNMFTASTGASTYNFATGATTAATTKTLNIGTGGAASSTTNINIGSSNGGLLTSNCRFTSPRMACHTSSAIELKETSFTIAEADNGKIYRVKTGSAKTGIDITLTTGISIGWRAKVVVEQGFVNYLNSGVTSLGAYGASGGAGSQDIYQYTVEIICITTNTFFIG